MSFLPGQLIPCFMVLCGKCKITSSGIIGNANYRATARRVLLDSGWEMSRAWGLICPFCVQKFNSPSVTTEAK